LVTSVRGYCHLRGSSALRNAVRVRLFKPDILLGGRFEQAVDNAEAGGHAVLVDCCTNQRELERLRSYLDLHESASGDGYAQLPRQQLRHQRVAQRGEGARFAAVVVGSFGKRSASALKLFDLLRLVWPRHFPHPDNLRTDGGIRAA